jgi:quercetin 2,3-dioxygenase
MNYKILPANSRGKAEYGWLNATYLYSFSNFYDPNRMGFKNLLVINHDIIGPESGFGMHSHSNMEIITIPLNGTISHEDNTDGSGRIESGNIQYMSAGTLITHSEINKESKPCELLQIWIEPKFQNQKPYYKDQNIGWDKELNTIVLVVDKNINLEAKLYMANLNNNQTITQNFEYSSQLMYAIKGNICVKLDNKIVNLLEGGLIEIEENTSIIFEQNQNNVQLLLIELV